MKDKEYLEIVKKLDWLIVHQRLLSDRVVALSEAFLVDKVNQIKLMKAITKWQEDISKMNVVLANLFTAKKKMWTEEYAEKKAGMSSGAFCSRH